MKQPLVPLSEIGDRERSTAGGKAAALARLVREGFPVPPGICVPTSLYRKYLKETGIGEKISLELSRKDFSEMRWEEIWDCALRIRNFFLRTPLPISLSEAMIPQLKKRFGDRPVAVRSSAPGEDDAKSSFAGLHESFVNVRGIEAILLHVRLVWASLWSDSALLYRRELGLDVTTSTMAVIVQDLVQGERSGVAFSMDPQDKRRGIVESVWGLNQGLVDGTVEPDRWLLDRDTGKVLRHDPPSHREQAIRPLTDGTGLLPLDERLAGTPPLNEKEARQVFNLSMNLERLFGSPQDMEWTFRKHDLLLLQARPITTLGRDDKGDRRPWYMSLSRSFENLVLLGKRIEDELLPAMDRDSREMADADLSGMDDSTLTAETRMRLNILEKWEKVYWDDFIPFAHGVRLFGQFYNDRFQPENPFDFVELLRGQDLRSTERNREIRRLAGDLLPYLHLRKEGIPKELRKELEEFLREFGPLPGITLAEDDLDGLLHFLSRMGNVTLPLEKQSIVAGPLTETEFLAQLPESEKTLGRNLLQLGRKSWKFRDDDNIYLGRIQGQVERALREVAERVELKTGQETRDWSPEDLLTGLLDPSFTPSPKGQAPAGEGAGPRTVLVRQIRGQPAGPGLTTGKARVIAGSKDLKAFQAGEVLVCDAIDPTMTFIVPMASAVVERRGGMLIHGAIIAREYGIPCVTGIPDVTNAVRTGDTVTVDGHLGLLVIMERGTLSENLVV